MKFRKPLFWDLKRPNLFSNILYPLTIFIKLNNFLLNLRKKKLSQKIKTICVGNIYLGGTGKTPTTIKLYDLLKNLNINICTAKKFYKSQNDEIIILKKKTNFLTGFNREDIIKKAQQANKDLLIFDDGLQDKNITYDLQFVCFDSTNWIGNGRLIPSGPLRENLNSLKKYDVVFLKDINENTDEIINIIKSINPEIKIFITNYKIININQFNKDDNFIIFSGIGNPKNFKNLLKKYNLRIIKEIIFPDHYEYKKQDIEKIKFLANETNSKIITTEKDYVKIKNFDTKNINFLEVDLEIKAIKSLLDFIKLKLYE